MAKAKGTGTDGEMHRYRTHTCEALRADSIGSEIRLSGWVHRVRDHGGVLFIDLRDHYGITQVVADPDSPAFKTAEMVRSEWVIRVDGKVRERPEGTTNDELPTGAVEIFATEIEVLSKAAELPVPVFGEPDYPEDMRLTYRFLDLRRETLHANIMKRMAVIRKMRRAMEDAEFQEFATPILTASSPEGARDFLVPSRLHEGKFYALPQAPQIYKQLLMVSGFDRYFQIAPCFRDEDPRADRLPGEFYQLDVEMSFVTQEDIFQTMEPITRGIFEEFAKIEFKDLTDFFDPSGRMPNESGIPRLEEAVLNGERIWACKFGGDVAKKPELSKRLRVWAKENNVPNPMIISFVEHQTTHDEFQIAHTLMGKGPWNVSEGLPRRYLKLKAKTTNKQLASSARWVHIGLAMLMKVSEGDSVAIVVGDHAKSTFEHCQLIANVSQNFEQISYDEAIAKYGSDKPDLRNPIEMQDVTEHFRGSGFKVFAGMIEKDPKVRVWAIPAPTGGSRAFCDRMNSWAQGEGQPGLGYIMWREVALPPEAVGDFEHPLKKLQLEQQQQSMIERGETYARHSAYNIRVAEENMTEGAGPIAKNIGQERVETIRQQLGLGVGDAVFFAAGNPRNFHKFAGAARDRAGQELKLLDEDRFELCWIVDFPMYDWNEDEKRIEFSHNPFSMPQGGLEALQAAKSDDDLLALKAWQYDLVCNGSEIASGSIRNHLPDSMITAFGHAGMNEDVVRERFGSLYRAFQYGPPPHGGMALGIDRIVMLLVNAANLREVSLFPMNQQAQDLLMGSPAEASPAQLRELSLRIIGDAAKKA